MPLLKKLLIRFEGYAGRNWYEWILALLAGADYFVIVIPVDGLVISSTLLVPKKWLRFAALSALGSALGAYLFAILVNQWGYSWLAQAFPSFISSAVWVQTEVLFQQYGLWIVFIFGASPIALQPVVALAILSNHSPEIVFAFILSGRILKYTALCAIARWAPSFLQRLWGVRKELEEAGYKNVKSSGNK